MEDSRILLSSDLIWCSSKFISQEQYELFKAIEEKLENDYWLAEAEKNAEEGTIGVEASMALLRKYVKE